MKNKKNIAICSLVVAILSAIPLVLPVSMSLSIIKMVLIIGAIAAIVAIVLGIIGIKGSKGLAIAGIVIGVCSLLFTGLTFVGLAMYSDYTECVDNGDGTSTCLYDDIEVLAITSYLEDSQFKEE